MGTDLYLYPSPDTRKRVKIAYMKWPYRQLIVIVPQGTTKKYLLERWHKWRKQGAFEFEPDEIVFGEMILDHEFLDWSMFGRPVEE